MPKKDIEKRERRHQTLEVMDCVSCGQAVNVVQYSRHIENCYIRVHFHSLPHIFKHQTYTHILSLFLNECSVLYCVCCYRENSTSCSKPHNQLPLMMEVLLFTVTISIQNHGHSARNFALRVHFTQDFTYFLPLNLLNALSFYFLIDKLTPFELAHSHVQSKKVINHAVVL